MLIRDLRAADIPQLFPLLDRHFPEEQRLLGWRPTVFNDTLRDLYRWHIQLVVRLAAAFGRPIYRCFVVETEGHLAATALLTYAPRAGYVSTVMVDDPYRRRGYARQLLEAAATESRRRRRRFLVLDVLESNAPARRLYESAGFRRLRRQEFRSLEYATSDLGAAPAPDAVRAPQRADRASIVRLADEAVPADVAAVLPMDTAQLFVRRAVVAGLRSEAELWVAPRTPPALGFVRATTSQVMESANLTCPILSPALDDRIADQLVAAAVAWTQGRGARRMLCEVPDTNERARALLARAGFTVPFATLTLVREL